MRSDRRADDRRGHAVVVGGGMAGLSAAAVCARHFSMVTMVERDELDGGAQPRKGVPQGRMLHALLPGGRRILDRMFPGYSAELEDAGAVPVEVPRDVMLLSAQGWLDRRAPGWTMLSASRPLLEAVARGRLLADDRVRILDRHEVTAVRADHGRTVRGVTVRSLDAATTADLPADLVIDAAGRGSRTPAWLEALGVSGPEETAVDPQIAYASQLFRVPERFAEDWQALMLLPRPPSMPRAGYLFPIEGDQWMVGLMGSAGQHPPTDAEGFHAFARSLRHPALAEAIAGAEPVAPARAYLGTVNRLRHYERVDMPDGLVALGDAVCAFNPIYGQGISTAVIGADTLHACLRADRVDAPGVARRFQRRLARRNADPWLLSTGEDLRFPTTTGAAVTRSTRVLHRYLDRVVAATTREPDAAATYLRVMGMLARPVSLFAPSMLAAAARARATDPSPEPPPAPDRTSASAAA